MMLFQACQSSLPMWVRLFLPVLFWLPKVQGECPIPSLPPHSSLRGGGDLADTYPPGSILRLQCIPGYEYIPGIIPKIKCLDTSKWSDLPTFCQGRRCPVPRIEDGKIVSSDDLRLGEEITLGCNEGFRMIGGTTRRCVLKSGKVDWNRELPTCERIPCARPPLIANGRYDPSPSDAYDFGWTVIYRCDPDYSLIGNSTITCIVAENGVDGKWDWPSPECKKVKCYRPSIPNGKVASVFQATYTYQNKITIECNPDYTLVGSSLIECDADGQWKPVPRCEKSNCTSPVPPLHSTLKEDIPKEGYPVGTVLTYHCITGYEYIPGINPSITCLNTSKWSEIPSLCQGEKCPTPHINDSKTDADDDDDIRLGGNVTFSCVHGYRLAGEATVKCILKDGKVDWNREFPICEHIPCNRPDNILNGHFDPDSKDEYYVGSTVIYHCNSDFSLIGNSTITCITTEDGQNGKWNLPAPECKNIPCNRPDNILNGHFDPDSKDEYYVGSTVIYHCNSDFSLIGNSTITCITTEDGQNGKWNLPAPECKNVKCDPPKVENGELVNFPKPSYTYNEAISFKCNSGYSAVESLHIKCGANSSWVPAVPECVKDNCTSPVPPLHSTLKEDIPKEGYPVGTVRTYHCITGYEYIPGINPSITCLNTSKWSEISSLCQVVVSSSIQSKVNRTVMAGVTEKPNTTSKAEYNKATALGKLIILLVVLYNCW